jgi:alpha-1,2-mannosyltransferase
LPAPVPFASLTAMSARPDPGAVPRLLILAALAVATVALSFWRNAGQDSGDLIATWMAGRAFAAGELAQVYPAATGRFDMLPPPGWEDALRADGYRGAVYPFIYPPLWAWVGSLFWQLGSYRALIEGASLVNPALLFATLWLALRNTVPPDRLLPMMLVGLALFASSLIALVALEQNQPQILVALLTVLAVDRSLRGAPWQAGAALALAASIKLYPALFALLWLAQRRRREALSFAAFGAALALASIALAGWPLHRAFLAVISDISGTALVTFFTWSVDPTIAQHLFADRLAFVADLGLPPPGVETTGWQVMTKPAWWRLLDSALLAAVLAGLAALARHPRGRDPLFWPLAYTLVALVSPLSWGYHYLAPLVFAPALASRLTPAGAVAVLLAVFFPGSVLFLEIGSTTAVWEHLMQPAGTMAMAAYAIALATALRPSP